MLSAAARWTGTFVKLLRREATEECKRLISEALRTALTLELAEEEALSMKILGCPGFV